MRMGALFINQDEDDELKMRNPSCSGDINVNALTTTTTITTETNGDDPSHLRGLVGNCKKNTTLTMLSCNSSSSADSGHPSGNFEEVIKKEPLFRDGSGSGLLTKYLVLLQDCIAIKFVAISTSTRTRGTANSRVNTPSRNSLRRSFVFDESPFSDEDANVSSLSSRGLVDVDVDVGGLDPQHSVQTIQGIQLFKSFTECNLKCFWNATLCNAINSLEYNGWLLPSTILVGGGGHPHHLSVVRTAWARKMLRNPPGFRIDFIGEIEEIIAEPVSQGQFAPLSDSLCWAILELTSSGQEAFVDSILSALANAFPLMSLPPRELVYTTLEKLIRDRKIYQTSHGYFIVSPDTFRYMSAGGEGQGQGQSPSQQGYPLSCCPNRGHVPLDALTVSYYDVDKLSQRSYSSGGCESRDDLLVSEQGEHDITESRPLKRHNSLRVIRQRDLDQLMTPTMGARSLSFRLSKTRSLIVPESSSKELQHRHLNDVTHSLEPNSTTSSHPKAKKSKKPSFFRRFFSFRRSTSKPNVTKLEKACKPETLPIPNTATNVISQKKPVSLELLQRSPKIYAQLPPRKIPTMNSTNDSSSKLQNRSYEHILEDEIMLSSQSHRHRQMPISKWNSLPSSSSGRRSRRSILNESPFYDVIQFNNTQNPTQQQFIRNQSHIIHGVNHSRASSSLGYGSGYQRPQNQGQRPQSMGIYSSNTLSGKSFETLGISAKTQDHRRRSLPRIDSPSPSVSAIYASIGSGGSMNVNAPPLVATAPPKKSIRVGNVPRNKTARTEFHSNTDAPDKNQGLPPPIPVNLRGRSNKYPPWRPRSAYELLAYQNLQNSRKLTQRKPSLGNLQPNKSNTNAETENRNYAFRSHHSTILPNTDAEVTSTSTSSTSTSTITSRTELQLQIPIGRMVNAANAAALIGGRRNGDNKSSERITVQLKTNDGCSSNVVSSSVDNGAPLEARFADNKHLSSPNSSTDEGVVVDVAN